jgi:hypothetical protein
MQGASIAENTYFTVLKLCMKIDMVKVRNIT